MIYVEVEDKGDWWDVRVGRRGRLNSLLWQGSERKDRIGHSAQYAIGWGLANLGEPLADADAPQYASGEAYARSKDIHVWPTVTAERTPDSAPEQQK